MSAPGPTHGPAPTEGLEGSMFWLNPLAWLGLTAIAVPIVVHLLAHRRAERVAFPTLRFLRRTRLAAIRRRALEDVALLAVRSAIIVAAVAAFAGPLLVTPARQAQWNQRVVTETVDSSPLSEGIHRAVARLESAPPARQQLVIAAPLTIGSVTAGDLAVVPAHVGIRFVRTGNLPATRTAEAPALLTPAGEVQRTVSLVGSETRVREGAAAARAGWAIEIVAPERLQRTVDAARAAALGVRVPAPLPNRRALLVLLDADQESTWRPALAGPAAAGPSPIRTPWVADAVARIARDPALLDESRRTAHGFTDRSLAQPPWHPLTAAADGRPVAVAAASGDRLLVASIAADGDLLVPTLLRAVATNLAPPSNLGNAEIVPIPDSQLRAWTRDPGPPPPPRPETVERDDRRWLWGAVLLLLAIETWMRRQSAGVQHAAEETRARVA
jgi:hypothetical protein